MARFIALVFFALFIGFKPAPAAADPFAYVTNFGSNTVSVIDTATNTVVATVFVGAIPFGVAVTPDGAFAYVTNLGSNTVSVIAAATNTVVATVPVGTQPIGVAVTPDGAFAYVTNQDSNTVSVIATATNTVVDTVTVGRRHFGVAVTPDGAFVYATKPSSNSVSVIATATNTVVATVPVGSLPTSVAVTPDGAFAYVANRGSNNVSVIATATNTVVATVVGLGRNPRGVAIAAGGNEPPVANAGPDQAIRAGDTVVLDGTESFDDNTSSENLNYAWTFSSPLPGGSAAALMDDDTANPSFVADVAGTYTAELIVTDEGGLSSTPDEVEVSSDNLAPTANAGIDQLLIVGETVFLNGSGSTDPEGDPLTYSWTITSTPTGSTATLAGADTVDPTFIADLDGAYVVELVVSDFLGPGTPDKVEITAATAENFAELQIVLANDVIASLLPGEVTTQGNQTALLNFLSQAVAFIQSGNTASAISKLENALERNDGCFLRGEADGNGPGRDWITDCTAQGESYTLLTDALNALTP